MNLFYSQINNRVQNLFPVLSFAEEALQRRLPDFDLAVLVFSKVPKNGKKETINLSRLRIVLAEKNKTNRWLADQLAVTEGTVSKWATNSHQPPLETLYKISLLFKIDINDLIESTLPSRYP